MHISKEKMRLYQKTARKRHQQDQKKLESLYLQAWDVARKAASILRTDYGAQRIVVFGSLANKELFHLKSDVDLAVWGLNDSDYFRTVAQLLDIDPTIEIDVVRMETAKKSLQEKIILEGIDL